jgi:predicted RNA-binding Zn-ribbon protein involved in translation (DUF1610 family)
MATKIAMGAAEKVWFCQSCEEVIEDPVTLYECGECGTIFSRENSADGNSHKCPDCNRFAAKLTAHGCPDCEEEDGCEQVMAVDADGEWIVIEDMVIA